MTLSRLINQSRSLLLFAALLLTCLMAIPAQAQLVLIPSEPTSHGPIPDGLANTENNYGEPRDIIFNVSGVAATVVDASVSISVDHTWVGDLRVTLIAPNGNPHTLFERTGATTSDGPGFETDLSQANPITFSDGATENWWTVAGAGTPIAGAVSVRTTLPGGEGVSNPAPESSFKEFLRSNPANGTWILRFEDGVSADTGEVFGASLQLVTAGAIGEVTSAGDSGPGTLRQAMLDAQSGDMITFASPLFDNPQTISLETALPYIETDLAIQGPGADLLTVRRADNAPDIGIFYAFNAGGYLTISGMTLSNGKTPSEGGGIVSQANLTLDHVHITGNQTNGYGGGLVVIASTTLLNTTIDHNTAGKSGGGILFAGENGDTRFRLFNSTISHNHAGTGSSNSYGPDTGGISATAGSNPSATASLELVNSTVVGNTGAVGGILTSATGGEFGGSIATTTISNSIVTDNIPDNLATFESSADGNAEFVSAGFNLSDNFNGITTQASDITADPKLGPLALQGGSTPVHMPLGGSPALANGNRFGQTSDQRGQPKPLENPDIGAVEVQSLLVTNADDSGTGSLRAAMTAANVNGAGLDDILFDPLVFNVPQNIVLQTALPVIDSSLTINGPRADMLTIARESDAPDMSIFETSFTPEIVALSGMLLTNGRGTEFGGGVLSRANLSLTGMHITDNSAPSGGGVVLAFANGIILDSTIAFNRGTAQSGGIQFETYTDNTLQITNSTISNNVAENYAAIFNIGTGTVKLVNSTVALNGDAGSDFGAVTTTGDSEINLRNTILAYNEPYNLHINGPAGFIRSRGFNLSDDTSSSAFLNQLTDQLNIDAGIGPLSYFGGPTPVHALTTDSPAIDAGNNAGSGVLNDQRGAGFARSVDIANANTTGSDGTDIGAYEAAAVAPVAQFTPEVINLNVDYNGLAFNTLSIENIGGGQLNVSIEPLADGCNNEAPWLSVSIPVINGLTPGNTVGTLVELDPTVGDRLLPGSYQFQLCIATNEPAQPERTIPVNVTVDGASDVLFRDSFEDF